MEINRNNYQAYLLDLMEGRLTSEDSRKLRDFLLLNPDCDEGLNENHTWYLEPGTMSFEGKENLKKVFPDHLTPVTSSNFELLSIARLEGDLSSQQVKDHDRLVDVDAGKRKEWETWKMTRLRGSNIVYSEKDRLIKTPARPVRALWISVISAAAVAAMLITISRTMPVPEDPATIIPRVSIDTSEESPLEQIPSESPVILADEPASLSIKKHQEPPELTGRKLTPSESLVKSDSVSKIIHEKKIESRPLKQAMIQAYPDAAIRTVQFDQIAHLDLPPVSSQSGSRTLIRERDFSLLAIANAGIKGINRLTGSDLSLNVSRDDAGEVSGFRFESSVMSVVAPVGKAEQAGKGD